VSAERGAGRPPGSDGSRARTALLDAATDLFAAQGYAGTTTRQISDAAGMQAGNLRHHFGTKADLFTAVVERAMRRVIEAVSEEVASSPVRPGEVVRRVGAVLEREPATAALLVVAPLERARHPELQHPLEGAPVELEHLLRTTVHDDAMADALIGAAYGLLLYLTTIAPDVDGHAAVEAFARLVDAGLSG